MKTIKEELENLRDGDLYPFHMPGHKRNPDAGSMAGYMDIDITEIDDYDNLHDAEGMILEAQKRAKRLYGADETFFLVNGSTSGVLSAVSAAVSEGGLLIVGRNSHKALYNAAYLRKLELRYLSPVRVKVPGGGFLMGAVDPEEVEKKLAENEKAEAVFITSPTYEGISSDIRKIADICHKYNKILIVDAAHGAHLGLHEGLPLNAVTEGADIVIHSVHKTLASMTQTAILHVQGDLVNRDRLRRFLRIYQSSSPSYVLMSSIDSCIGDIEKRGDEIFGGLLEYKDRILKETADCKNLFIAPAGIISDPCKVLVCARDSAITGQRIYDILRLEYRLQPEMAGDFYALMIITGYDTKDGIERLIAAIKDMDIRITNEDIVKEKSELKKAGINDITEKESVINTEYPKALFPIYKAWDTEREMVDITTASGRVSGEFINLYPPGIPLIAPGEIFTKQMIHDIGEYINADMNVQGVCISGNGDRKVSVLKSAD
ncbi:aminotransferase class I/II-fold pyridoxal phosphate-dependent enzyme [Butyrivibrio sp. XPD2002]|uniref:aminotransferase class I/II-fold pyridoxal phosphate-dependent enzyme n=1 Tax=Butyrivibrio sp. XPD2002 TaxID=1280665 RepID=UPI0003F75835|nr:aminotransferase class V-fold PLP-dependent enzyme [Butyrivibrio sp. XPD2002]